MGIADLAAVAADAAAILGEQATSQTVTYLANGGSPIVVAAIWEPLQQSPASFRDGRVEFRRGIVQTQPSDTPTPDSRDQFTIGSSVYAVETIDVSEFLVVWRVVQMVQHRLGGDESRVRR